ncbi:hypothetical protein ACE193_21650 [Bernardetia sp. OM2101]|uniref:hypothetical protein n=1 Tax=Bernardetia sp. OM2101 TaxID=3344876 RepID=UPI0035D0DA97
MDAELKIVGAIIIAIMFLANTGIGVWIYRIMKASERIKEVDKIIEKNTQDILLVEKQIGVEKENINDKLTNEREQRIKYEARITQTEKDTENLQNELSKNSERFINIAQKFDVSITHLNASMKNFSEILGEVKGDLKEIKNNNG